MTKIRDGYIFQDGEHFIVEAESQKAVDFIDRLCGYKWRMLTCTSEQDVHITTDKNTIFQLVKELKNASYNFENFIGA